MLEVPLPHSYNSTASHPFLPRGREVEKKGKGQSAKEQRSKAKRNKPKPSSESMDTLSWSHQDQGIGIVKPPSITTAPPPTTDITKQVVVEKKVRPQKERALHCPRCNSTNTKFCYYNNYSLTQPRYFCKTCRRYWTEGGSLRNVPVGGGSRKNKRAHSTTTTTATPSKAPLTEAGNPRFASAAQNGSFCGLFNTANAPTWSSGLDLLTRTPLIQMPVPMMETGGGLASTQGFGLQPQLCRPGALDLGVDGAGNYDSMQQELSLPFADMGKASSSDPVAGIHGGAIAEGDAATTSGGDWNW